MSLKQLLWNIPPQYHKFTNVEEKILETLTGMKTGNAYTIWKTSGLKHYPTVLRTLKKLHEKRLIQLLDQKGSRDEKIYISTLAATLMLCIIKEDTKKLERIIADNSNLFSELVAVDKSSWSLTVAREIIEDAVTAKKQRDINEITRDKVEETLQDDILNISDEDNKKDIARFARIKWVRDFIVEIAKDEIAYDERHIIELKELVERLQ